MHHQAKRTKDENLQNQLHYELLLDDSEITL